MSKHDSFVGPIRQDWLSPRPKEAGLAFLGELSSVLSKAGDHSRSLDLLVQQGKYRDVLEYEVPFGTPLEDFRNARQIQALFSKSTWVDLGYDPLLEGVKAFIKAEQRCSAVNAYYDSGGRPHGRASVAFAYAREKIRQIMGRCPSLGALVPRYGPGANTRLRMAQASLSGKLMAKLACSEDMFPFAGDFLAETPVLTQRHLLKSRGTLPLIVDTNDGSEISHQKAVVHVDLGKLTFVPKSAKTHRPIVVEPPLNGFWQLGVGSYLKDRLRAFSIDLYDQERNRTLARKGSVDGSLATIDLSSASDTVSWGLVFDLVPPEWSEFLAKLRTGSIYYDGSAYRLEKFSSMGNGYTFELESILFFGLAYGCCKAVGCDVEDIGIFGDDIIVPVESQELLFEVLDLAGFWVNPQKSFWQGPFRESCGADWLSGNDVRPIYVRDEISDRVLYIIHNWALRRGELEIARLAKSWTWGHCRLYGPDGYGDGHLLGSHSLYLSRKDRRRGWCGGYFDTYSLKTRRTPKRFHWDSRDALLPTYSVYVRTGEESPTDPDICRGSKGYVRTPVYTLTAGIFIR